MTEPYEPRAEALVNAQTTLDRELAAINRDLNPIGLEAHGYPELRGIEIRDIPGSPGVRHLRLAWRIREVER